MLQSETLVGESRVNSVLDKMARLHHRVKKTQHCWQTQYLALKHNQLKVNTLVTAGLGFPFEGDF
jgi:hypothetical protein